MDKYLLNKQKIFFPVTPWGSSSSSGVDPILLFLTCGVIFVFLFFSLILVPSITVYTVHPVSIIFILTTIPAFQPLFFVPSLIWKSIYNLFLKWKSRLPNGQLNRNSRVTIDTYLLPLATCSGPVGLFITILSLLSFPCHQFMFLHSILNSMTKAICLNKWSDQVMVFCYPIE